jgi:hypothetical protein
MFAGGEAPEVGTVPRDTVIPGEGPREQARLGSSRDVRWNARIVSCPARVRATWLMSRHGALTQSFNDHSAPQLQQSFNGA